MKTLNSALSKPVAYIADCGTIVSDSDPFFDDYKNPQPIYSQEYVSALLAELEAKGKRIAEAEVRGVEKLAAAFKSWASDETFPDCEAQRHWATASQEALSFAGDLRNGSCDDR